MIRAGVNALLIRRFSILLGLIGVYFLLPAVAYGCAPIRTVIKSGSRPTETQGRFLSWNPRPTVNLAKSGSIRLGILFSDGGSALASSCPNTLAASAVACEARLLTNTIIPRPNPLAAPHRSAKLRFVGTSFHFAPGIPVTRLDPKIFAIAAQVSIVSWSGVPWLPQTNNPTRCPANGDNFAMSSGAALINNFARGPKAAASSVATSASLRAILAEVAASPACCVTSASNCSLLLRNSAFLLRSSALLLRNKVLICCISRPLPNSPIIPIATNATLTISTPNFTLDGLLGDRSTPAKFANSHVSISSRYSYRMTHHSIRTPITTKLVNPQTDHSHGTDEISRDLTALSRADMALSRAEMELSKAEESVGRREAICIAAIKITMVALIVLCPVFIFYVLKF